jgi:hypothetical protein
MTTKAPRSGASSSVQSGLATRASPDARKTAVLIAIRSTGLIPRQAALSCGVASSTFYFWLDEDPGFAFDVTTAEAVFERRLASVAVRSASQGSWASALHVLERRFPERWGQHSRVDLRVDGQSEEDRAAALYQTPEDVDAAIAELQMRALATMSPADLEAALEAEIASRKERSR